MVGLETSGVMVKSTEPKTAEISGSPSLPSVRRMCQHENVGTSISSKPDEPIRITDEM